MKTPPRVRYNDWRAVEPPPMDRFAPKLRVSVVMPAYQTPAATLAMTLAALEGQSYPRDLFEVVVVDDGSEPPLVAPPSPLAVKVVRLPRRGFGIARARNAGVGAAAGDIVLFLDSDMLAEPGWLAAHARWHHVVGDALTVGLRAYVDVEGLDAVAVREAGGKLHALLRGRPVQPAEIHGHLLRTADLTTRADDPYRTVMGCNFGIGRDFHRRIGGSDESFARWGFEDVELGYRAFAYGGLIVPLREAFAWHQGRRGAAEGARKERDLKLQRAKLAHLVPHPELRDRRPGRRYAVPRTVVSVTGDAPPEGVMETVLDVLADRDSDLAVRIENKEGERGSALLQEAFAVDPRVFFGAPGGALGQFPTAAFHVALPAGARARDPVSRLRRGLADAVVATVALAPGSEAFIARTWALHRARRMGCEPNAFGAVKALSAAGFRLSPKPPVPRREPPGLPGKWRRLWLRCLAVRSARDGGLLLKWAAWRCAKKLAGRANPVERTRRRQGASRSC